MKKQIIRSLVYGLLAIGVYLVSQLVQLPAIFFLEANGETPLTGIQLMISLVIYWMVIVGVIILALRLKLIKPQERLNWKKLCLYLLGGQLSIYVVNMLGILISLMMGDEILATNQATVEKLMTLLPSSLMFTMLVAGAPILEEVVCRGLIPRMFSDKSQWLGYLLGAVLFGLAHHPSTIGTAVQYIGMGIVLSSVAYFSKRLEYSILLHFLQNSMAFTLLMLQLH